ncbi:MAG: bifunctional oligoribonuclease/PAP phosphatase NrnA, partial [Clostridia bacterium]|nr:bifunctional oligoribonuclease/PAP phosphatase NrnA [Clostridia bacterium]
MKQTPLQELAKKLFAEKSAAIFCHVRPDGDTVGSATALKAALIKSGVKADVFCEDVIPKRFDYLGIRDEFKTELSGNFSAFVAIDCADEFRLGKFAEAFLKHENTYCVDHHVSNVGFAKYFFVSDRAANAENVYDLIKFAGVSFDKTIADRLLTGIATDTGAFRHKNVTPETFAVASELVKFGADLNGIIYHNFTEQSPERAKLFGMVMSKIRYFYDGRLAIATVFQKDLISTGASSDETEGFVDFVMGVSCVEVGVCLMEMGSNSFKVSLRSKGPDVNGVASEFGGGGHVLASGCRINGEYEEVVDKLCFAV